MLHSGLRGRMKPSSIETIDTGRVISDRATPAYVADPGYSHECPPGKFE